VVENVQTSTAVQEEREQSISPDAKKPPESSQTPKPVLALDDKSPIWSQSMRDFEKEHPALHKLIKDRIDSILEANPDKWDTWLLNRQPKDETNEWFRKCKAFLPRFKTVKGLVTGLSKLDPHNLAPYVANGVFVFVEVRPNHHISLTR